MNVGLIGLGGIIPGAEAIDVEDNGCCDDVSEGLPLDIAGEGDVDSTLERLDRRDGAFARESVAGC